MANYKNNKSSNNNYGRQYNDANKMTNNKQKKNKGLNAAERHEIVNIKKEIKVPAFATAIEYIGKICLILLAFVAIVIDTFYVYYKYINKDVTIGSNYIDDQVGLDIKELSKTEGMSEEQLKSFEDRVLFNINIYDNTNKNGEELYELRLDYFTDPTLTSNSYRSTGMQVLGRAPETELSEANGDIEEHVPQGSDLYYYDTKDGISWSGGLIGTQLNRAQELIIKIDNKPFSMKLTGKSVFYTTEYAKLDIFKRRPYKKSHNLYETYASLFEDCVKAVKSNSAGYGDYYLQIDLSHFFTIKKYNTEKLIFEEDAVDVVKNYAVLKFHFDKNGVKNSKQSMFGKIALNSKYDEQELNSDLWLAELNYNLTAKNFNYRYSANREGHLAFLNISTIETLNNTKHSYVNITLDLDDEYLTDNKYNLIGLDFSALENLKINSLTIKSSKNVDFNILSNALKNTGLTKIHHNSNVNIINLDSDISIEGVIV